MKRRDFLLTSAVAAFIASGHSLGVKAAIGKHRNYPSWRSDNIFLQGINAPVFHEVELDNLPVTGEIPQDLAGVYLRNGPNPMFQPTDYNYPLEGDGMLHGVYFQPGKVSYRNRWIRTRGLLHEMVEGQTLPELKFRNYANTNIIAHSDRLLALYEVGLPHSITTDLKTVGEWDFNGALEQAMTAHPKLDPQTGELHFYRYSFFNPPYLIYYVSNARGEIIRQVPVDLEQSALLHDMALTQNYAIFFHCPLSFSFTSASGGNSPFLWQPERGTKIILVPRRDDAKPIVVETEAFWMWHFANAWEHESQIIVDYVYYPRIQLESTLDAVLQARSRFQRAVIDPHQQTLKQIPLGDRVIDFPTFDPRRIGQPYRYCYFPHIDLDAIASKGIPNYFPELIQYDVVNQTSKVYPFGRQRYGGEATFVPRQNSTSDREGYVLTWVYDEGKQTSDLVILDVANFEAIAFVHLPFRVPMGLHGNWISASILSRI